MTEVIGYPCWCEFTREEWQGVDMQNFIDFDDNARGWICELIGTHNVWLPERKVTTAFVDCRGMMNDLRRDGYLFLRAHVKPPMIPTRELVEKTGDFYDRR